MITIRNTNTGAMMTVKTLAKTKEVLRTIVKNYGGRQALNGIYIDMPGEKDPHYAVDWKL